MNKIITGDTLESLKTLADSSVHLIFTSPPYSVNLDYGIYKDNIPYNNYLKWLEDIFTECNRVLVTGGRLVINIDSITNMEEDKDLEQVRPIYAELVNMMRRIKMNFFGEICWYKQNISGKATAWGSWCSCSHPKIIKNHEHILIWSKGQFKLEGDSELSDMTPQEFAEFTRSTWHIAPETRKMAGHPAPFPEKLAERIIKLFSYRDNVVMDIFSGTGTTAAVAARLARQYIGIDINDDFNTFAKSRIKKELMSLEENYIPRSQRIQEYKDKKNKDNARTVIDDISS